MIIINSCDESFKFYLSFSFRKHPLTNSNKTCGIEVLLAVFSPTCTFSAKCDIGYLLSIYEQGVCGFSSYSQKGI